MTSRNGFTLVEALLAVAVLAIMAGGLVAVYSSAHLALEAQAEETAVCSQLRSAMERVIATPFADLTNGIKDVVIENRVVRRELKVANVDLDGDGVLEPDAVQVTLAIEGRELMMLLVDGQDRAVMP